MTCRLTGGGARVPLSIVDVRLAFDAETPVLQVRAGERLPPIGAHLQYTGNGRLQGRWEVVLPGQEAPTVQDLLTEATLPDELRGSQKRYVTIERFNVFLPPTGRYTLVGPDSARLPTGVNGQYLLLLRIEKSDDKEADSDLSAVGAGPAVVHAGGVAGFPMPTLRYVVGAGGSDASPPANRMLTNVSPADGAVVSGSSVEFSWVSVAAARYYRLEVNAASERIHQAFVSAGATRYALPPFVEDKASGGELRWRVVAIDATGRTIGQSDWRRLRRAISIG